MRVVARRRRGRRRARAGAGRQGPVHRLAGGRARGRARVRLAREGGHGRAGRQGRDARARRRAPAARGRGRAVGGLRGRGPGARLGRARLRGARAATSASSRASSRGAQALARRRPRGPAHAGRAARLALGAPSTCDELVEDAVAQGAQLHCGGPVTPPGCDAGAFYAPAVLTDVTHEMRLMREPIDGPVLAVVPVDTVDEAIALANDSDYGLGASVWTADRYQGVRIARELRAGMVWLNDHLPGPDRLARAVGRGGRRRARAHARAGGAACVRAGEADHVGPAGARAACGGGPTTRRARSAARAVAKMRSGREADRERAWRDGAAGARADGRARVRARPAEVAASRAVPPLRAVAATLEACPPRPTQARSASVSCAGGSATRAACRGCSTRPSTSPA